MATELKLTFENSVFGHEAIKRALYRFADRCSCEIASDDKLTVVTVYSNESENPAQLEADIRNEILDQDLRSSIAQDTQHVRNLILANAFSKTNLISE
jgi:His-Xaa-Ser system protein HxsD